MNYHIDQINKLADPGVFGCAIQIRNNDNGNATTWMNITDEQLVKIRDIFANDEPEPIPGDWLHVYNKRYA